jgi:hypothetical protein
MRSIPQRPHTRIMLGQHLRRHIQPVASHIDRQSFNVVADADGPAGLHRELFDLWGDGQAQQFEGQHYGRPTDLLGEFHHLLHRCELRVVQLVQPCFEQACEVQFGEGVPVAGVVEAQGQGFAEGVGGWGGGLLLL